MPRPPQNQRDFKALCEVVQALRGKDGCPWDREQTHESLVKFAIEETFELAEAIESQPKDDKALKSELGDVLFQVVLHSEIARQEGRFDIADVIQGLNEKMIRRHPHVFSDVKVSGSEEVVANWQKIKAAEKANKGRKSGAVLDTPKGLPALMEADKIGGKTKKLGFDWSEVKDVLAKVKEEVEELEEALNEWQTDGSGDAGRDKVAVASEIGDVLFSVAQLARHLEIDAEQSLRMTNQRFRRRFQFMLDAVGGDIESFTSLTADEKEKLWSEAKRSGEDLLKL